MDTDKKLNESKPEETVDFNNYDPTLDLSSYKYPPLELLENYNDSRHLQYMNSFQHQVLGFQRSKV
jgi:hypothetical protein